ncbi:hypothetical protein Q7P37_007545 [Cladosporium fusiforme]
MRRFGIAALLAAIFIAQTYAQTTSVALSASTTYAPTHVWAPAASCTVGSSGVGVMRGGVYRDDYGSYWQVGCDYDWSSQVFYDSTAYYAYSGTNGQGIFACFRGCASRVNCVAFTYTGTITGPGDGSGRCFAHYRDFQGSLYFNGSTSLDGQKVYASAYMFQSSPSMVCPYFNNTAMYTTSSGQAWFVICGGEYTPGGAISTTAVPTFAACIAKCEATSGCTGVSWSYTNGYSELRPNVANTAGFCYMKNGGATNPYWQTRNTVAAAYMTTVVTSSTVSPPTTTTTTTTTSSSSISIFPTTTTTTSSSPSSSTSAAPSVNAYRCPASDGQTVTDAAGSQYYLRCYSQASGGSSYRNFAVTGGFNDCFNACSTNENAPAQGNGDPGFCSGFSFFASGGGDGSGFGAGSCFFRNTNPLTFSGSSQQIVGLIKVQYYSGPPVVPNVPTTTTTTTSSSLSIQTVTFTTVSFATVTATSSYPVTTTAVSTQYQTLTTSYPVTQTQVTTAPGKLPFFFSSSGHLLHGLHVLSLFALLLAGHFVPLAGADAFERAPWPPCSHLWPSWTLGRWPGPGLNSHFYRHQYRRQHFYIDFRLDLNPAGHVYYQLSCHYYGYAADYYHLRLNPAGLDTCIDSTNNCRVHPIGVHSHIDFTGFYKYANSDALFNDSQLVCHYFDSNISCSSVLPRETTTAQASTVTQYSTYQTTLPASTVLLTTSYGITTTLPAETLPASTLYFTTTRDGNTVTFTSVLPRETTTAQGSTVTQYSTYRTTLPASTLLITSTQEASTLILTSFIPASTITSTQPGSTVLLTSTLLITSTQGASTLILTSFIPASTITSTQPGSTVLLTSTLPRATTTEYSNLVSTLPPSTVFITQTTGGSTVVLTSLIQQTVTSEGPVTTVTAEPSTLIITSTAGGSTILITSTFQQTFTAAGPTVTYTASPPAYTFTSIRDGSTVFITSTLGQTVTQSIPGATQTLVQTYTSILPASTEFRTIQGTLTEYSTIQGGASTITYTAFQSGTTEIIERTVTASAVISTFYVTQPAQTLTQTKNQQTYYVTATTTMPAASIYYVQSSGAVYTVSGETRTVTVAIAYVKHGREEWLLGMMIQFDGEGPAGIRLIRCGSASFVTDELNSTGSMGSAGLDLLRIRYISRLSAV